MMEFFSLGNYTDSIHSVKLHVHKHYLVPRGG